MHFAEISQSYCLTFCEKDILLSEVPFKIMLSFSLDNTVLNASDYSLYILCTYAFEKKGTPRQSTIYGLLRNTDDVCSNFSLKHIFNAKLKKKKKPKFLLHWIWKK